MAGQVDREIWIIDGVEVVSEMGITPAVNVTQSERNNAISNGRVK